MSVKRRRIVALSLLLVIGGTVAVGAWLRATRLTDTRGEAGDQASPTAAAALRARALLRIATDAGAGDGGPSLTGDEQGWLEDEVRYLLTRGQVPLARPQGPYDPENGSAVFRLELAPVPTGLAMRLTSPAGVVEHERLLTGPDRLARMHELASALPGLLPRGDTGAVFTGFLGTEDPEAYDALAQAQMITTRGATIQQSAMAGRDTAIDRLESLTRTAPEFARAWSALAWAYLLVEGEDSAALSRIAGQAADRALSLDEGLAEARAVQGAVEQRQGRWLPADERFTMALALDPASPPALEGFACLLLDVGRVQYARLLAEQAVRAAPDSLRARECLEFSWLSVAPGRPGGRDAGIPDPPDAYAESLAAHRPGLMAALLARDREAARTVLGPLADRDDVRPWVGPVLTAIAEPGSRPEALRAITQAADDEVLDPVTEVVLGAALEQADFAFNRLARLHAGQREVPSRVLWLRETGFLREHARFAAVAGDLGLRDYWRQRGRPDWCSTTAGHAVCNDP